MRFYEVQDKSNLIKKSSSLKPKKSSNGRIIGGTFNIRQGSQWTVKQADQMKIYALIRKRSEYKKMQRKWLKAVSNYDVHAVVPQNARQIYN